MPVFCVHPLLKTFPWCTQTVKLNTTPQPAETLEENRRKSIGLGEDFFIFIAQYIIHIRKKLIDCSPLELKLLTLFYYKIKR